MAPGLSKKGQISETSNVSKTFASGLPRRISILHEPVLKSITSQNSTSQPGGGKRELAFSRSTSLIRTQTLLGVRETVNSDPPTVVTRASSRVSGKHPNPHSPSSNNDIPSSPSPHGMSNSPTTVEATSENDVQDGDQATHKPKQGRGPTRGLGLHKRNRRFDKKFSVTIDPIFGRALTRNESTNFANELGQIAQAYVWPISKAGSRNEILPLILLCLQEKMKAMVDSSKESDHPITPEKALQTVLGTKSGYCKGMGYGPTPPSSKRARMDSEIAYRREMNKKLSEESTKGSFGTRYLEYHDIRDITIFGDIDIGTQN
ncbi:hypothetical protein LINGRAHAP2_LOCUS30129 [Linum grandiflorum]